MRRLFELNLGHPTRRQWEAPVEKSQIGSVNRYGDFTEWRQAGNPVLPGSFSDCWRWCGQ